MTRCPISQTGPPSVEEVVARATRVFRHGGGCAGERELAAAVLYLADLLDQANLALEAALSREDEARQQR